MYVFSLTLFTNYVLEIPILWCQSSQSPCIWMGANGNEIQHYYAKTAITSDGGRQYIVKILNDCIFEEKVLCCLRRKPFKMILLLLRDNNAKAILPKNGRKIVHQGSGNQAKYTMYAFLHGRARTTRYKWSVQKAEQSPVYGSNPAAFVRMKRADEEDLPLSSVR